MSTEPLTNAAPNSRVRPSPTDDIDANPTTPIVRACVHASGTTTSYLRTGTGSAVVLLGESFLSPSHDPLVGVLAKTHRVVVPDLPGAPDADGRPTRAFSSWLRSFLDGLGAADASLVARDGLALATLAFALTDTDRVRRLVLSFRDARDPLDAREALTERLEDARCRLLVVRETPEPRTVDERTAQQNAIVRFLAA